jgi:hypothetical protein
VNRSGDTSRHDRQCGQIIRVRIDRFDRVIGPS